MKKGKLLTTICMLVMTISCLTFGVFALIKTAFTASGTITFNAYNLDVDVEISATGTETEFTTLYYSSSPSRDKHSTTGKTWQQINNTNSHIDINLTFDDTAETKEILLKFKITNYSDYALKANGTSSAVTGINTSVENVAYIYKNVTETMASGQTAPEAHYDYFVVHFTPNSSESVTGNFNVSLTIEPSEYQEDAASTYTMDTTTKTQINGYTGTKDYLVIPRVVNGYNVTSVIAPTDINGSTWDAVTIDGKIVGNDEIAKWDDSLYEEDSCYCVTTDGKIQGGTSGYHAEYDSCFEINTKIKTLVIPSSLSIDVGAFSPVFNSENLVDTYFEYTVYEAITVTPKKVSELDSYSGSVSYGTGDEAIAATSNGFYGLNKLILASGGTSVDLDYFKSDGVVISELYIPYGVTSVTDAEYGYTDSCVKTLPSTIA